MQFSNLLKYLKQITPNTFGITQQDVIDIRQAFESLRDENDRPNEVKLSKLRTFPFFNKSDLSRFPNESDRMQNGMRDSDYKQEEIDDMINKNQNFYEGGNNDPNFQQQNSANFNYPQKASLNMENKEIECQSIMCGCSNPKQQSFPIKGIRERSVTFDEFFDIMCEKMRYQRQHQHTQIIFENKESNVSCFLWPLFGTQQ